MRLNVENIADKADMIIKSHYKEMYLKWIELAETGFYGEK